MSSYLICVVSDREVIGGREAHNDENIFFVWCDAVSGPIGLPSFISRARLLKTRARSCEDPDIIS